ncbi:MAG: hypothetical protein ACE3L7_32650 [Candidatus Pristimantibacillus sp.]
MNSREYEEKKQNLRNYFNSDKFRENEIGERVYYKGRRNLKELKYILDLVFGEDYTVITESPLKNETGTMIGGFITCKIYVSADFNGFHQGTAGAYVYTRFNLIENAYYLEQSQTIEGLDFYK